MRTICRRIVSTIAVMAMVGIFVFLLLRLAPGDPAAIIAGKSATAEVIAGIREQLGLNDPMPVQFARWVRDMLSGDFGTSIFAGRPMLELISQLESTLSLSILTMVPVTVGVFFGILAGANRRARRSPPRRLFGTWLFRPGLCHRLFFHILLRHQMHWLPVQGYVSIGSGLGRSFVHFILPTVALGLGFIAFKARVTLVTMLEVLSPLIPGVGWYLSPWNRWTFQHVREMTTTAPIWCGPGAPRPLAGSLKRIDGRRFHSTLASLHAGTACSHSTSRDQARGRYLWLSGKYTTMEFTT